MTLFSVFFFPPPQCEIHLELSLSLQWKEIHRHVQIPSLQQYKEGCEVPGFILPPRGGFSYWLLLAKERCSTHDAREDSSSFRTDTGHIGVTICTPTLQCGFLGEWVISKFHPCPPLSHSPALSCWVQPQPQLSPLTVPLTSLLDPQSGKTRQGTCWEDRLQGGSGGWRMMEWLWLEKTAKADASAPVCCCCTCPLPRAPIQRTNWRIKFSSIKRRRGFQTMQLCTLCKMSFNAVVLWPSKWIKQIAFTPTHGMRLD